MKLYRGFITLALALVMACALRPAVAFAAEISQDDEDDDTQYSTTILFTHDMHSHFLPVLDGNGVESGGFARLATLIEEQRAIHPDALILDGGDFSMGSLFQAIYATDAAELRLMGAMGIDVTTFGNHEFDYRQTGLSSMLEAAVSSGDPLPLIVESNYVLPDVSDPAYSDDDALVQKALDDYGVKEYTILERGGIQYGIFGITGEDSDADAPESGMILLDAAQTSQKMVDQIRAEADPDLPLFIICLSHSGTDPDPSKSEDEILAANVDGIDVIISAHTHTVLEEPIQVNDTLIVSAGCYTANLGVLTVGWNSDGSKTVIDYELIPVDETVAEDPEIAALINEFKDEVVVNYLSAFGYDSFDQVIGTNSVSFDSVDDVYAYHRESGLGDLIADSFIYAVTEAEGEDAEPVTLALTASGVIRETFPAGDITVSDVFNVSSLGIGTDGLAGYPLVEAWLTGKEIKAVCEVDASIQPLMSAAQLHFSGITFTWNNNRMIFNKVYSVSIMNQDGTLEELEDDRLYRVVTGLYCAQMLSAVEAQSFGILSITPKYADGTVITDFDDCILYDQNGNEIKEWYALASYISSFDGGEIPASYENAASTSRKIQLDSWNPVYLFTGANWITIAVIVLAVVLILIINLIAWLIIRRVRKSRDRQMAASSRKRKR